MKYWKPQEMLSVLAEAKKVSARNHLLVLLAYKHGLRASELCRLTLNDVRDGRLDCKRLKGSLHTNRPLECDENVLLDEKRALAAYLRERIAGPEDQFLFTGRVSLEARRRMAASRASKRADRQLNHAPVTGISRFTVTDVFEDACFKAGIERGRRNPHLAKHTLGALAYRAGVDIVTLQQLLGHRDPKSTLCYTHLTQDEAHAKARSAMSAVFA